MAFDAIQICFGELNMRAEEHIMKAVQQVDVNVDKEKLIKAIKATDFVDELIYYIFNVQEADDDNISAEVICRKLVKHGLIDKVDGYYKPKDEPQTDTHDIRTDTHGCVKDTHDKTEPQTCSISGKPYTECESIECESCEYFKQAEVMPQTGCAWKEG